MFSYFEWKITKEGGVTVVKKDGIGIEVFYAWFQKGEGKLWLFGYIDENSRTIKYFAFDSLKQKKFFEGLLKLPGIWPKTAFNIASLPLDATEQALQKEDVKFFEKLPGIWPKTAKRIIVELKDSLPKLEEAADATDLAKKIVQMLSSYGYGASEVKKALKDAPFELKEENLKDIVSWLVKNL